MYTHNKLFARLCAFLCRFQVKGHDYSGPGGRARPLLAAARLQQQQQQLGLYFTCERREAAARGCGAAANMLTVTESRICKKNFKTVQMKETPSSCNHGNTSSNT